MSDDKNHKGMTLKQSNNLVFEWGLGKEYRGSYFDVRISVDNLEIHIKERKR